MTTRLATLFAFLLLLTVTAGCGGGDDKATSADSEATATEETATEATAGSDEMASESASGAVTEMTIKPVGNQMQYEQTEFTVPAGEEITVTFENVATSPAMQHNVVFLNSNSDEDVQRVGTAALAAGADNAYIPEDDAILAHTALSQPGETVEVTFTAPSEPGDYRYICTFPGHYALMQGTMTVVAS
jgi:azurin